MKHFRKLIGTVLILSILFLTACLPKVNVRTITPMTAKISNYETILIYVSTLVPDSTEQVSQLEAYIIKYIDQKGIFKNIVPYSKEPTESTDLRLYAKILELRKGGFVTAAFTYPYMRLEVILIDVKTGKNIGVFEFLRTSGQRTTEGIIMDVSERIAKLMAENY